ncbi:MAG: FecCD family ABC transporter permease [Planctomycetota bacterium]
MKLRFLLLGSFVVAAAVLGVGVGPVFVSPGDVLASLTGGEGDRIVETVRLPRVAAGLVVGASLAVAGALFQALLRNALAEPYLLGVGPGALLGVTVAAVATGVSALPPAGLRGGAAFLGALAVGALIFSVARRSVRSPTASVLLAGIAVGAFVHAVATLLLHAAVSDWHVVVRWMLGDLGLATWGDIAFVAGVFVVGGALAGSRARALDVMTLGDEAAWFGGVAVPRALAWLGGTACLLAASTVAVAGLVGFVGLVVPHLARGVVGTSHRRVLPASALLGAGLLVLADALARTAVAPEVLPLGVVTALLGAPFLAWLVLART